MTPSNARYTRRALFSGWKPEPQVPLASGSRTFLDLTVLYGDFLIEPEREEDGKVIGVRIASCGDDGLEALMKALDFSLHAYIDQCSGEDD